MIYVTGDIHGQYNRFETPEIRRIRRDDVLLICGDFGFIWNGGNNEEAILRKIGKKKFITAFVDGAHENFDLLSKYETVDFMGGRAQHICGNLYHLLRGEIYEIEGKRVFAFGGGESADQDFRLEQNKWWAEELPVQKELRAGLSALEAVNRKVNYIITHLPPERVHMLLKRENTGLTNTLAVYFEKLSHEISFEKWFFGNLHTDRQLSGKYYAMFGAVQQAYFPESKRGRK